jgi:hypothetical protein
MLQNTVGDIADLANFKQLSDQVVARGGANLGFEEYLELLLSACSTNYKTHATPRPEQQNVYATSVEHDNRKDRSVKVNEASITPDALTIADTTYI